MEQLLDIIAFLVFSLYWIDMISHRNGQKNYYNFVKLYRGLEMEILST